MAICDALSEAGCSVRYFTSQFLYDPYLSHAWGKGENIYFRGLDHKWLLNYPRIRRLLRGITYPIGHLEILSKVDRERPDIIHIQWSRIPRFDLWLIKQIQARGIPVVHTVHDVVPIFDSTNPPTELASVYDTVDKLIVHTNTNKNDFLATYPQVSAERVTIVPLIEFFAPIPEDLPDRTTARKKLKLPLEQPTLGFFGAVRHYKGLDILLDAFSIVRHKNPDIQLMIAGQFDQSESDKLPDLDTVRSMQNVHFYEGYLPTSEVWMYHLAPDVFVLPYRHIYQSGALITAMSYGCPIIATDVGGMPEAIDGNGWIVPPEDPNALASAILDAIENPEQLRKMSNRSKELIATRHSKEIVAQKLVHLYASLIDKA